MPRAPLRVDLFRPAFVLLVLVLSALVIFPMFWLIKYSLTDAQGAFSLSNFSALATDATLRRPFLLAIGMALSVGVLSCVIATPLAWLVSRTDLPGRRIVRALVTASFVTPPFLGAIAWEILAAPNSGLINVLHRYLTGSASDVHLVNIYTFYGLIFAIACYTFPYVFTSGADDVRFTGHSCASGRLSCDHNKNMESVPVSAQAWTGCRSLIAFAFDYCITVAGQKLDIGAKRLYGIGRQER
jgi:ABC-type sulfate transport system permease component